MTARVSMLLKSCASPDMLPFNLCNKKGLQFSTWTDPYFQIHYRFPPTTPGSRSSKDLSAPPRSVVGTVNRLHAGHSRSSDAIPSKVVLFSRANRAVLAPNQTPNRCVSVGKVLKINLHYCQFQERWTSASIPPIPTLTCKVTTSHCT